MLALARLEYRSNGGSFQGASKHESCSSVDVAEEGGGGGRGNGGGRVAEVTHTCRAYRQYSIIQHMHISMSLKSIQMATPPP